MVVNFASFWSEAFRYEGQADRQIGDGGNYYLRGKESSIIQSELVFVCWNSAYLGVGAGRK